MNENMHGVFAVEVGQSIRPARVVERQRRGCVHVENARMADPASVSIVVVALHPLLVGGQVFHVPQHRALGGDILFISLEEGLSSAG